MMIKEFAISSVANRHHFQQSNEIPNFYNTSQNMFHSLYDYDEYVLEYVKKNQKMSGFDGILYMPDEFILDVDGKTTEEAQKFTTGLIMLLNDIYIPYQIYFSGTGFHVNIPRSAFKWRPSKNLHLMVKKELESHGIFDFADVSVTDKTRLIRIPHTLNTKSRLWKIPITDAELAGSVTSILTLAQNSRRKFQYKDLECEPKFDTQVNRKETKKSSKDTPAQWKSNFKPDPYNYPCIQTLMNGVGTGSRHASALRIAAHLRWRYPEYLVQVMMEEWRIRVSSEENPFTEAEMESIIKSSYDGHNGQGNNYGCNDPIKDKHCQNSCFLYKSKKSNGIMNASAMEKMLFEFYTRNKEPLNLNTMCDQSFPIFPGEVVIIQAPPKSMKTIFLMNLLNHYKKPCYMLEMEMSPRQIWQRFLMMEMNWTEDQIKEHYQSFANGMDKKFEWLFVDYESCYVNELSKRISQLPQKPEIIVIDHIGLMKSKNNDNNFKVEDISQGLTNLAIQNDIIVFAISEITKSAFYEGKMNIASSKGSFRLAYNANKVLSITPYRADHDKQIIKSLHVECTANRESEHLDVRFNVKGINIIP